MKKTDKVSHWYFCMLQYWLYLSIHTAHSPNHRGLHESLLWVGYRLEVPSRIISWPPKKDQLCLQHRIGFVRFCQTLSLLPLSSQVRKYKDANLRMNSSSHSCWPHHGHRKHFPRQPARPPSSKDAQISYFALLGLLRRRSRHVYVAQAASTKTSSRCF